MAVQIIQRLLSDLSGDEAQRTTRFGLDGKEYSVDLTEAEDDELRSFLEKYVRSGIRADKAAARPNFPGRLSPDVIGSGRPGSAPLAAPASTYGNQKDRAKFLAGVREWAEGKGLSVPHRGRIPQAIMDMYTNRHALESAAIAEAADKAAAAKRRDDTLIVVNGGVPVKANGHAIKTPAGKTNGAAVVAKSLPRKTPAKAVKSVNAPLFSSPAEVPETPKKNGRAPVKRTPGKRAAAAK